MIKSIILASALILSLTAPSFASGGCEYKNNISSNMNPCGG